MNKTKFEKAVYYFVLVSMLISIIYVIYRIIAAPSISNDGDVRTKSTYTLMLLQCIVGVVAIHIPDILEKHLKRDIPSFYGHDVYHLLYCAIFLGEVRSFYYLIPNWDNFLHTFFGHDVRLFFRFQRHHHPEQDRQDPFEYVTVLRGLVCVLFCSHDRRLLGILRISF